MGQSFSDHPSCGNISITLQESNPNDYARLNRSPKHPLGERQEEPARTLSSNNPLFRQQHDENYDTPLDSASHASKVAAKAKVDSENVSLNSTDDPMNIYDYIPSPDQAFDDYDYESPFWEPSSERKKLMQQFRKLGVRSITQKELE